MMDSIYPKKQPLGISDVFGSSEGLVLSVMNYICCFWGLYPEFVDAL